MATNDRALFTAELILTEKTDPETPPAGSFTLFPQADGKLYLKNSNGDIYPVGEARGSFSDVRTSGSALANQVGVWVSRDTLEGFGGLSFNPDGNRLAVGGILAIGSGSGTSVLQLGANRIEMRNIGFVDANTATAIKTALNLSFGDISGNLDGSRVTFGGTPDGTKFLRDDRTWQTVTIETFPSGAIMQYAGAAAPSGWLLCQGQALSTAAFPNLFSTIGYTYGGSGSTFNLPDLRQRVPVGVGTGFALGATGGAQNHTLTVNEMPAHSHTTAPHTHGVNDPGHNHSLYVWGGTGSDGVVDAISGRNAAIGGEVEGPFVYSETNGAGAQLVQDSTVDVTLQNATVTVNSSGGGQPHNNMQPYLVLNYIIKT